MMKQIWGRLAIAGFLILATFALAGFLGAPAARADFFSDHQLAGLVGSSEVYVAGEPGYEEGMWHHITPAELATIAQTGAGINDVTWYTGTSDALPGSVHVDPVVTPTLESDHQLAGLLSTGQVYVTGEPGYAEGAWTPVTAAQLATITQTGAGWFDVAWYGTELPGTVSTR